MGVIYGTNGNNNIYQTRNGFDDIYAYGGNDTIHLNRTGYRGGDNYVEAGSGNDTVINSFEGDNDIYLGSGNDTYFGNGFSTVGKFYDVVWGGTGKDVFNIRTSHSDYYGQGGRDEFNSIGLNNHFNGGGGKDMISYSLQDADPALRGLGVYVNLEDERATTGNSRKETLINIENVEGTSYADTLVGANPANKLYGLSGRDILDGRDGKDSLFGGNGNDDLYGGTNNDKLIGGRGNDLLFGESGADHFIFTSILDSVVGSDRDVIKDFQKSVAGEVIDLSGIDAQVSNAGNNAFDYIGSSAFSGTEGELQFKNGILRGDIDGDKTADFEIRVAHVSSLGAGDFIL